MSQTSGNPAERTDIYLFVVSLSFDSRLFPALRAFFDQHGPN